MVELRAFKVNKLEVENTVAPGTQLKLQNQFSGEVSLSLGPPTLTVSLLRRIIGIRSPDIPVYPVTL